MGRPSSRPLVGRTVELGELTRVWREAVEGRPGLVMLGGDAGVGKTRLLQEVIAAAGRPRGDDLPAAVLVGACVQVGDLGVPYLPVVDALRSMEQSPRGLELLRIEAARRPALARLIPHLRDEGAPSRDSGDLGTADGTIAGPGPWGEGLAQGQLFEAVHRLLTGLGETSPVLLVLEDLHWADAGTRALLAFLARTLRTGRVAVLCSYRSDDLHRRHPLRPLLADLARLPQVTRLTLPPLVRDEIGELLDGLTGQRVGPAMIEAVFRRSQGNAFFAEELAGSCRRELRPGVLDLREDVPDDLPDDLTDLLLARVEALGAPGREALRMAAVAGRPAPADLLVATSELPPDQLEAGLRQALEVGLLVPVGPRFGFRHALLQEVVYRELLPSERIRLHGRFAAVLSAAGADSAAAAADSAAGAGFARSGHLPFGPRDQVVAAELAHHRLVALDLPGALAASVDAAADAERVGASAEALRHLEQAVQLLERLGAGADVLDLARRAAEAAMGSGDPVRAVRHGEAAVAEADRRGEVAVAAAARERLARYLMDYEPLEDGVARQNLARMGEVTEQAVAALRELPDADRPATLYARALATRGRALVWIDPGASPAVLEQAVAAAESAGAPLIAADALVTRAQLARRGVVDEDPVELLARASERVGGGGEGVHIRIRAIRYRSAQLSEAGDPEGALAEAERGITLAAEAGVTWSGFGLDLLLMKSWILEATGRWDEVLADGLTAVYSPSRTARVLATVALGVLIEQGRSEASTLLARLRGAGDYFSELQLDLREGRLHLRDGRPQAALAVARQGLARLEGEESNTEALLLMGLGVDACAESAESARFAGRQDQAAAHAAAARELADRASASLAQVALRGPLGELWRLRIRAQVARTDGRDEGEAWLEVGSAAERAGRVPEQLYALHREVAARLSRGDRGDRTRAAGAAGLSLARRLGAEPVLRELSSLFRHARLRIPDADTAGDGVADGPAGLPVPDGHRAPAPTLTPREHEVLALVASGRSNRQIGRVLTITDKTASVHVSNIMTKLGAASRTEAVAVARRRGLLTGRTAPTGPPGERG